ncbi:MAG: response regulator [Candidatus Eisenbacteria bacterium]|nr:response regulator [Candidatus Eisenbacteria bacterium]
MLLVEDDDLVRGVVIEWLVRAGYEVFPAAAPDAAFRLIEEKNLSIDLVVTDTVMPGMSGPEMIERLRAHDESLRVLYMSGYLRSESTRRDRLGPAAGFIEKPFTAEALLTRVRELLGEPSANPA